MNDAVVIGLPTEKMLARIEGPIGWMTFNNPARRNAVSLEMWAAIPAILDRFETDADADLALSNRLVKACFESEDFIEGRRAFMEKRRPVFRGV
jgi:enoyl-CoA hydratase/carnithine racemase